MKSIIIIASTVFSLGAWAQFQDCVNEDFQKNGWTIHSSSEFETIYKDIRKKTTEGVADKTMVQDIEAMFMTPNSFITPDYYVRATTWDVLATSNDVMYGDIAIFVDHFKPETALEVRWFDGEKRHLVYNDKILSCAVTTRLPIANTIF